MITLAAAPFGARMQKQQILVQAVVAADMLSVATGV
jgi:hypothetical protein